MNEPGFIFITCQIGAEAAVKGELARNWPGLRFAYSRPGFLTFKFVGEHGCAATGTPQRAFPTVPSPPSLNDKCEIGSVFARAASFSLGKAAGATIEERAGNVWKLAEGRGFDRLHVWQRDLFSPDHRSMQSPDRPAIVSEAEAAIRQKMPPQIDIDPTARTVPGNLVLDCVLVEPDEWWVGCHRAFNTASCWPGGLFFAPAPPDAVSRAYLKMEEALAWSRLPARPGDLCVEIGAAPGGSSQALLNRGLRVIGIDPADIDPVVVANPNFEHWKMRGADVRRREFRKVRWLTADMNVAPRYTLDTVEAIVTHREVHIEGLLLTLKLMDGTPALEVPEYLKRVSSWGFAQVEARQLHHNRHDFCLAAMTGHARRDAAVGTTKRRHGKHRLL
jgi:23S rRNA (cytidine2498-2'-O)-methyltransferase